MMTHFFILLFIKCVEFVCDKRFLVVVIYNSEGMLRTYSIDAARRG